MTIAFDRAADLPAGHNLTAARALAAALASGGADVFVSPGSRSTPLVVAFDELAKGDDVALHVVLDERVAGFAALGASRATRRPAILVCTSGTAAGHYLPALMEASASRIPLIAVTADRPPELHHCGAPQTVAQRSMFSSYVRWCADLPTPGDEHSPRDTRWLQAMGMRARAAATGCPAGPVHLNAPFRKPLHDAPRRPMRPVERPMTIVRGEPQLDMSAIEVLADELEDQARGVIHCGPRACAATDCDALEEAVTALSSRLGWPVIADGASGVRGTLHHADALCRAGVMPPVDFALRIGRAPTNKAVDAWLANAGRSVLVDRDGWMLDPNAVAQTMVIAEPARAIRELELSVGPRSGPSSWQQEWRELDRGAHQAIAAALPDACAAMVAAHAVAEAAARSGSERPAVHVASSMAVRDFDLVARRATATSNRGVNGIDGTIATALGIALATGQPTVALLGDLALAHDLGGLHAATQAGVTLTLVVVNNGGGGIFEMLPVAGEIDRARFERLFATPQSLDIRNAAQALGARYVLAKRGEIAGLLEDAPEGVAVIEIREDREREAERRAQTWQRVTAALRRFSS